MLARMFHTRLSTTLDENGRYFIDGNGEMFRLILDFLRRNKLCLPKDFRHYDLLLAEAEFYGIEPLVECIREITDSNVVTLNVGGTIYTASLEILRKYTDSYLACMLDGRVCALYDEQGRYFVEANGELFKYVLDYLRRDELILPDDFNQYDLLLIEAEFFRLDYLVENIRRICRRQFNVVSIKVGDKLHHTTMNTLRKYPHSSLLRMLKNADAFGRHCIDTESDMFSYVLDYLRKDSLHLPSDFNEYESLLKVAKCFDINPLVREIKEIMDRGKEGMVPMNQQV